MGPTKMYGKNGKLLMFGLFLIFCCKETSSKCKQLTSCSCVFPNGYGYSLSPLNDSTLVHTSNSNLFAFYMLIFHINVTFFFLFFSRPIEAVIVGDNRAILFHPCTNVQMGISGECKKGKGASLCLQHGNDSSVLGTAEETHLMVEPVNSTVLFVVHHNNYTTKIALECCTSTQCPTLLVPPILANDSKEYDLKLISPYSCKKLLMHKGLSTGTILLICFFSFSALYFIGGAIALKLLRGATGWEMVPDHKFWLEELPSYVKDGVGFTFNCCHADSYQKI
ncbi:hypothetical protein WH47_11158 [Habropoda laboriosa]|uniref:Cation-dependent mannose-6-phosphate receptor n=1 Tax=Habropoda laboriosa TaxID=597456 RepID=A0A0L7RA49_9HYME|nr:PREDICTED: uncharacterized protein LOC108570188 isoform X1 [Habropoda laboriosa]XP_017787479.1 PREDICTED: uncharacterized protein LOC108570188 isoform X1 [Habropoda laboriosa]KOC67757.1 hypothetical protein WH47_11158 [Habropoda laboriosa]